RARRARARTHFPRARTRFGPSRRRRRGARCASSPARSGAAARAASSARTPRRSDRTRPRSYEIVRAVRIERLADGLAWPEGPTVLPDGRVVFVETYRSRIGVWARGREV